MANTSKQFTVFGWTARGVRIKRRVATLDAVASAFASFNRPLVRTEVWNNITGELLFIDGEVA